MTYARLSLCVLITSICISCTPPSDSKGTNMPSESAESSPSTETAETPKSPASSEEPKVEPAAEPVAEQQTTAITSSDAKLAKATFGGGCFWCTEAVFQQMVGVQAVVSGYSGGKTENPTYEQICTGTTGHAEVVQITYDPAKASFVDLLEVFFATHDPTTLNRQGNDIGTQYRSVIFYHNDDQKEQAQTVKKELDASGAFSNPIVTEISPLPKFYEAEKYHQNYYRNNPYQGYCQFVVRPKVEKFQKVFKDKMKKQ